MALSRFAFLVVGQWAYSGGQGLGKALGATTVMDILAIKSVERSDGKCEITLTNNQIIPVSQRYWEVVKQLVGR